MSEPTTAELVERVREGFSMKLPFQPITDSERNDAEAALTALQSRCEELERERDWWIQEARSWGSEAPVAALSEEPRT